MDTLKPALQAVLSEATRATRGSAREQDLALQSIRLTVDRALGNDPARHALEQIRLHIGTLPSGDPDYLLKRVALLAHDALK